MPDEQSTTQHSDAVPPGWQVLPDTTTAAPDLLPGRASHGSRLSLLGIDHHLGRFGWSVLSSSSQRLPVGSRKFAMNTNLTESSSAPLTETPEEISRRRFFEKLSIALVGLCTAIVGVPLVGFIVAPFFSEGAQGMGHARQAG